MTKKNLVIVESPAKAKTIGKYLGSDYTVKACMGHLRDLPKSVMGVDIANDFEPDYKPIRGKEELIKELKKLAKTSDTVYLATDPDREGEAISWHLQYLLGLDNMTSKRVTFNEITKRVVQESIAHPRDLDMNLIDAQQARRVLDRVVGYEISPIMWRKIKRGLSAGRVQSVATRMVYDRDLEIENFQEEEYWSLDATLSNADHKPFIAHYHGKDGKKHEPHSEQEIEDIISEIQALPFLVSAVKKADKQRSPTPPFTTSTLQQEASRKLNMTPRRTMAIAQQLYEGIELGNEGSVGLITYMRTDSLRISEEAQKNALAFIEKQYGKEYCPSNSRVYKTKEGAQDAHEAIRPTSVAYSPEKIKEYLTGEQYRLYRLIWSRFLSSQMANAVYNSVSTEITVGRHLFRASASSMKFAGYTIVYEEGKDEDKEEKELPLPKLEEGEKLSLQGFEKDQHFTQPPAHFTEATLIRAMEENGIGRPSTYAPTVSVILDRRYVNKEGKYLVITNLGRAVTGWMEKYFENIADLKFTASMEQQLDDVEKGTVHWKDILRNFYGDFQKELESASAGDYVKVANTVSEEICPICGQNLVERDGKFGTFLACPGYPNCTFTMPLVVVMPGSCPTCGGRLMKRSGTSQNNKQYTYYCCEFYNSKQDRTCDFKTWDVPVKEDCPVCGHTLFKRSGRGFNRPFCINGECSAFVPEEKRGYIKTKTDGKKAEKATGKKTSAKKSTAKKKTGTKTTTTKKSTSKKTTTKKSTKNTEDK